MSNSRNTWYQDNYRGGPSYENSQRYEEPYHNSNASSSNMSSRRSHYESRLNNSHYQPSGSTHTQSNYVVPQVSSKESLEAIQMKAARSNLTPNASEFVPKFQNNQYYKSDNTNHSNRSNSYRGDTNVVNRLSDGTQNLHINEPFSNRPKRFFNARNTYCDDSRSTSRNANFYSSRNGRYNQYDGRYDQYDGRFDGSCDQYDGKYNERCDQYDGRYDGSNVDIHHGDTNWQGQSDSYSGNCDGSSSRNSGNSYNRHSFYSNKPHHHNYSNSSGKSKSSFQRKYNYASQPVNSESPKKLNNGFENKLSNGKDGDDDVSRRDYLINQLNRGTLDCLVCTERIRQVDKVWNCTSCFNVLHLKCIIQWADSSKTDSGWRCPACQNVTMKTPREYYCFCGKSKLCSEWNRVDNAHSCGEICGKTSKVEAMYKPCEHTCTLLCHPGPCPVCTATVSRDCGCGRTAQTVQCSSKALIACDSLCSKPLNCNEHFCQQPCHFGDCQPCTETYKETCHCGRTNKVVVCGTKPSKTTKFSCGKLCNAVLNCNNHKCKRLCHENECEPCKLLPELIDSCCCGKTPLTAEQTRQSCTDPIPTCELVCEKILACGPTDNKHICKHRCHEGNCPPCNLKTRVKCRCGSVNKEVECAQLTKKASKVLCAKKCSKKRSCGKHKCNQNCCIDTEHICPIVCNRWLSCGQHRCELLCHQGNCLPCSNISFDELTCHCRSTVMYPPIPCGTRPPVCNRPCTREHNCDHDVMHNCHSGQSCPPCPVLTVTMCYGGHETRSTIPCHIGEFSCGLACSKPLPCKKHKCIEPCHKGSCVKPGKSCTQPCPQPRALCSHICGQLCHAGPCPDKPCREMVKVTCQCGHRTSSSPCFENNAEYEKIIANQVIPKSSNLHFGLAMDFGNASFGVDAKQLTLKILECNSECQVVERNRNLAIGLQIRNPDLSAKLAPRYSEFMMQWFRKNPQFCQHVHDKLTSLVQLAKQSKQKTRSFSFEVMNREKRQFVHEYCEHFGCESKAYDAEPKRNIVATASKDTSWLPSYSLMEVMQRQSGQRKIHVPSLNAVKKSTDTNKKNEMLPLRSNLNQQSSCWTVLNKPEPVPIAPTRSKSRVPDYFNDDL